MSDIAVKVGMDAAEFRAGAQRMGVSVQEVGTRMNPLRMSLSQLSRESRRVWRETRTPMERYTMEVQKLAVLHKRGAIDLDTYNRAVTQQRQRLQASREEIKRTSSRLTDLRSVLLRVAGAFGVGIGVYSFVQSIRTQFVELDRLGKTADKLGLVPQRLLELRHAAELSGVGVEKVDMGLQRMVRRVSEAARGTGEARGALRELGVDAQQLARMSPDAMFVRLSEAMQHVPNQSDRVRLAFKLFDSEGVALVNTLAIGGEGLRRIAQDFRELHGEISRIDVRRIEAANDSITRMGQAWKGLVRETSISIAPAVEWTTKRMIEGIARARRESLVGFDIGVLEVPKIGFEAIKSPRIEPPKLPAAAAPADLGAATQDAADMAAETRKLEVAGRDAAKMLQDLQQSVRQLGWSDERKELAQYVDTLRRAGTFTPQTVEEFRNLQGQLRIMEADLKASRQRVAKESEVSATLRRYHEEVTVQRFDLDMPNLSAAAMEVDTYVQSLREAGRYTPEAVEHFRELQRTLADLGQQRIEAANFRKTFQDWQRQIRDFGLTAREKTMRDLAQKVDFKSPIWQFTREGQQFQAFRDLDRELSRLEQRASDIRAGERLREQFVTPAQEAAEEFRLLKRLIEIGPREGGFDLGMGQQVIDRRTMERMRDMAPPTVAFKEAGSREAYSAVLRHQYGGRDKALETAAKQLAVLQQIAENTSKEDPGISTTSVRLGRER